MKLIDLAAFRAAERAKKPIKADGVVRTSVGEPKAYDDGSRKLRFCFSDGSVDRMGDTIEASGWNLHAFERNPVALFAHDSSSPPIGTASRVMVEDTRLMGDIEFAPPETYAFADTIYRLVAGRWLRAVSVGFLPLEYSWSDDDEREWGLDFKRQELLEISVVPVPANGNALAEARSKGVDTRPLMEWAEKTLDQGGKVIIPRTELERLRKAAKEPPVTKPRAKPAGRREAPAEGEPDPADEAFIGNCGRPLDSECGLKNVSECSIHGTGEIGMAGDADDEKRLAAMVAKAVAEAFKAAGIKPGKKLRADDPPEPEADPDRPDFGSDSDEHEKSIRMCSMHMKAMGDALDVAGDHHEKAMDALGSVVDALDATPPPSGGGDEDDPEAKAARLRRIKALRERARAA